MARTSSVWLALSLLACVSPAAAAQSGAKKQPEQSDQLVQPAAPAAAAEASAKSATTDAGYVIGPEDVLKIDVWENAELSQTVPVRPDGKISLPLLNDVQAAGLTPTQLSATLGEKLSKYVTSAHPVTVIVTQINSQRVYVLGEVARAGAYPMVPGMTVLQVLSTAGGFTPFANTKNIYVLRTQNGAQHKFAFNYKNVVSGKQPEENIALKPGDTIVVP